MYLIMHQCCVKYKSIDFNWQVKINALQVVIISANNSHLLI